MKDDNSDVTVLSKKIKSLFGVDLDIAKIVVANSPVSQTTDATLFLSNKKQLYVYVSGQSRLLLGDIKKMVSRMGLKSELFFPPKGRPDYFNEIAKQKFCEVFPGRTAVCDDDLSYYRTLVPYGPALILVSEVKNGEIYRFDSDSKSNWRLAVKFAYRKIKTN